MTMTLTFERSDWYHQGNHMSISAHDETGKLVGWINALYHYKTNQFSDFTVRLMSGEAQEITVPWHGGRKALAAAKTLMHEMYQKSASAA